MKNARHRKKQRRQQQQRVHLPNPFPSPDPLAVALFGFARATFQGAPTADAVKAGLSMAVEVTNTVICGCGMFCNLKHSEVEDVTCPQCGESLAGAKRATGEDVSVVFDRLHAPMKIAAAAIRVGQMTFALSPPARHADVARYMIERGHNQPLKRCLRCLRGETHVRHVEDRVQGFITGEGLFVGRYQAHRIAVRAGQTTKPIHRESELTSEDVW